MEAKFKVEHLKDFTVMSNYHLRDKKLSLKAKGLQSLILSLPPTWDYTLKGLAAICGDGVDSISSALKELESAGYIDRKRLRNAKGQLCGTEYIIHQIPQERSLENLEEEKKPKRENPVLVKADKTEQVQSEGNTKQENKTEQIKSEIKPAREKPKQVKPKQEKPAQEKRPQSNIQELNIQVLNTNQSIYHSKAEIEAEPKSAENDGQTNEIIEQCLRVCKNELSTKQIKLLLDLMSFIGEKQKPSYFQHIFTRLEYQASKGSKKIAAPFAYLVQIVKNDCIQFSKEQKSQALSSKNQENYGAAYDLEAYENANPFEDWCEEAN